MFFFGIFRRTACNHCLDAPNSKTSPFLLWLHELLNYTGTTYISMLFSTNEFRLREVRFKKTLPGGGRVMAAQFGRPTNWLQSKVYIYTYITIITHTYCLARLSSEREHCILLMFVQGRLLQKNWNNWCQSLYCRKLKRHNEIAIFFFFLSFWAQRFSLLWMTPLFQGRSIMGKELSLSIMGRTY